MLCELLLVRRLMCALSPSIAASTLPRSRLDHSERGGVHLAGQILLARRDVGRTFEIAAEIRVIRTRRRCSSKHAVPASAPKPPSSFLVKLMVVLLTVLNYLETETDRRQCLDRRLPSAGERREFPFLERIRRRAWSGPGCRSRCSPSPRRRFRRPPLPTPHAPSMFNCRAIMADTPAILLVVTAFRPSAWVTFLAGRPGAQTAQINSNAKCNGPETLDTSSAQCLHDC